MGSDSDLPVVRKAADTLVSFGVPYEMHVYSAHRTPEQARDFSVNARNNGFGVIIAAAGTSGRRSGCQYHPARDRYPYEIFHLHQRH